MSHASDVQATVRSALDERGLLGSAATREACAHRAHALGGSILTQLESLVGARTARRALGVRRGDGYAESYRYVVGYGMLMTELLIAPIPMDHAARARVVAIGGLANLIVSYFDEMVDGGWPRSFLLPGWALTGMRTRAGRRVCDAARYLLPPPAGLTVRLVSEYFRRLDDLPHAARHRVVRAMVHRLVSEMYFEEGRTPREWRRIRGAAARQKKTALPLVVLGLPGWLATPDADDAPVQRHRRWLIRLGKFIRWIDDAADVASDEASGSANLACAALARRATRPDAAGSLAGMIARRGRWIEEEWRAQMRAVGHPERDHLDVLATVLVAWVGEPPSARPAAAMTLSSALLPEPVATPVPAP
jgi:hypothetical protein